MGRKEITTKEDLMKVIEFSKILELHTGWMADGV